MKINYFFSFWIVGLIIFLQVGVLYSQESCDVAKIYAGEDASFNDVKVLTSMGNIEDADIILVPSSLDEGKYELDVTRKGSDIYQVDGPNLYI